MWIRVESFASDSTTPSTTLNLWTDRFQHDSTLLSVGRKSGGVIFPADKSVSRQHCEIRCVKQKEGRRDVEQHAIEANPFRCSLVVENLGKSGTFIAELPQGQLLASGKDVNNSDDDATDDEGMISQRQSQQKSQLAPLGDGQLAPEAIPLSSCTKELWCQHINDVKLVKVDMKEFRVLDFSAPRSIIIQVGVLGSSIKISWMPLRLVFSRLPKEMERVKKDLSKIGAIEDSMITSETTHLVTPKASVSAKPLTACCRGLPIVTPDYLFALMAHAKPEDPIPPISDFMSPLDQNLILIKEKGANPQLMQGYTVFFLDNLDDVEALVHFSGGTSIALYDLKNEMDRLAKVEATIVRSASSVFLILVSKKRLYNKILTLEGVYSVKPEAWASSIFLQNPQLKTTGGKSIPTPYEVQKPSSREGSSVIEAVDTHVGADDSETDGEISLSIPTQKSKLQTQEELVEKETTGGGSKRRQRAASPKKAVAPSASPKKWLKQLPSCQDSQIDSSMTELEAPSRKRRKRGESNEPITETAMQDSGDPPLKRDEEHIMVAACERHSDQRPEQDSPRFPLDQNETMDEGEGKPPNARAAFKRNMRVPSSRSDSAVHESLGGVDKNGWYIAAPKDDSTRRAWRQKASNRFAEEDGEHFQPAAASKKVAKVVSPSLASPAPDVAAPSFRACKTNSLDFRTFRKNIVPRKIDATETIAMFVVQARGGEVQQELEDEQRQLEVQQRVADELFHDIGGGQPRRRRRE